MNKLTVFLFCAWLIPLSAYPVEYVHDAVINQMVQGAVGRVDAMENITESARKKINPNCTICRQAFTSIEKDMLDDWLKAVPDEAELMKVFSTPDLDPNRMLLLLDEVTVRSQNAVLDKYQNMVAKRSARSLCGLCSVGDTDILAALLKEFGSSEKAQAVLAALKNAATLLARARSAFDRRDIDSAYRVEFDKIVAKWIGKPTAENLAMLKERTDAVYHGLQAKLADPAQYLKNPATYPNAEAQRHAKEDSKAFISPSDPQKQIFLNAAFFSDTKLGQAGTIIHEESHFSGGTGDIVAWGDEKIYDREAVYFLSEGEAKADAAAYEYFIQDIPNPNR